MFTQYRLLFLEIRCLAYTIFEVENFLMNIKDVFRKMGKHFLFFVKINRHIMELAETIQGEIQALEAQLTGDMFQDMDIKDKIHNLQMKLKGVKPMDSHIDCIGCGS